MMIFCNHPNGCPHADAALMNGAGSFTRNSLISLNLKEPKWQN
jgi:hypothetical protein